MGSSKGEKYNEICEIAKDKFGVECLDDEYEYSNTKMTWIDDDGYKYYNSPISIKNSKSDELIKISHYNIYTIYNINNYIKINNIKTKLMSKKYINIKSKLKFKCSCGNKFYRVLENFLYLDSHDCNECSNKKLSDMYRTDVFELFKRINNETNMIAEDFELLKGEYINNISKVTVLDDLGYRYHLTTGKIFRDDGNSNHDIFNINNKYTYYNLNIYIDKNNLGCEFINTGEKYKGNNHKLKFKCNRCGNYFRRTLGCLTNKLFCNSGYCPECVAYISAQNNKFYKIKSAIKNKNKWKYIDAKLYQVKIYNKDEKFYKIGLTTKPVEDRFIRIGYKYNYKILDEIDMNLYECVIIEQNILEELEDLKYEPKIYFAGHTECIGEKINLYKMFNKYKKEVSTYG